MFWVGLQDSVGVHFNVVIYYPLFVLSQIGICFYYFYSYKFPMLHMLCNRQLEKDMNSCYSSTIFVFNSKSVGFLVVDVGTVEVSGNLVVVRYSHAILWLKDSVLDKLVVVT